MSSRYRSVNKKPDPSQSPSTQITAEFGERTKQMTIIYRHLQRASYLFEDIEESMPLPDGVEEPRITKQIDAARDMAGNYLLRLIGWSDDKSILNQFNIKEGAE